MPSISEILGNPGLLKLMPDNAQTQAFYIAVVAKYPYLLEYIENQTKDLCYTAVVTDWKALRWVRKPTRDIQTEALWRSGEALKYIDKPNKQQCLRAVRTTPSAISLIPDLSPALCLELLKANGDVIDFIDKPTAEMQAEAAASKQRKLTPFFKPKPTPAPETLSDEELVSLLKKGQEVLRFVSTPNPDICRLAVKKNNMNLEWVKLPVDGIMDPNTGQLEDWISLLQAAPWATEYAVRKVCTPIAQALPFKRKSRMDDWLAPSGVGGDAMMDRVLILSREVARLAPGSHWGKSFVSRVQKQFELCLCYQRPKVANPNKTEAEHSLASLDDVL